MHSLPGEQVMYHSNRKAQQVARAQRCIALVRNPNAFRIVRPTVWPIVRDSRARIAWMAGLSADFCQMLMERIDTLTHKLRLNRALLEVTQCKRTIDKCKWDMQWDALYLEQDLRTLRRCQADAYRALLVRDFVDRTRRSITDPNVRWGRHAA